jgi:hypothetical protein
MLRRTASKGPCSPLQCYRPLPLAANFCPNLQSLSIRKIAPPATLMRRRGYAAAATGGGAEAPTSSGGGGGGGGNSKAFGHTLSLPRTTFPLYTTEKAQLQLERSLLAEVSDDLYAWQVRACVCVCVWIPHSLLPSLGSRPLTCHCRWPVRGASGARATRQELHPARRPALR